MQEQQFSSFINGYGKVLGAVNTNEINDQLKRFQGKIADKKAEIESGYITLENSKRIKLSKQIQSLNQKVRENNELIENLSNFKSPKKRKNNYEDTFKSKNVILFEKMAFSGKVKRLKEKMLGNEMLQEIFKPSNDLRTDLKTSMKECDEGVSILCNMKKDIQRCLDGFFSYEENNHENNSINNCKDTLQKPFEELFEKFKEITKDNYQAMCNM